MASPKSINKVVSLPPIGNKHDGNEEQENPFKLPSDDRIFRLREEEKQRKQEAREKLMTSTIWEKSKSDVLSRSKRLMELVGDSKVASLTEATKKTIEENLKLTAPRRQEKENMTEFVAKKREMFLVQMSLDTKREEIRKLEEKAQMKEEALQRSEQMLEEDAMRFDAFLKENDKKAHDAIKKAEEETKKKQEKTQEIKRLTQQIQALSSEMSKHKESLEDCMRYKKFLDMLTPPEWFDQHAKSMVNKRNAMRYEIFESKMKKWEQTKKKLIEQHRKEMDLRKEIKKDRSKRGGYRSSSADEEDDEEPESRLVIPPAPRLEDEVGDVSVSVPEEEPPMYFTEPGQLMDIFTALEEQNLFLIQNSQETERTLEELQHEFKETKHKMDARTVELNQQIDELKHQILTEEFKVKTLLARRLASSGSGGDSNHNQVNSASQNQHEKEKLLNDLNIQVRLVYEQCGFDASSKPSTLFMLSQLESRLEALLGDIERMPIDYVIKAEKEKEKRRRERKREEQQALQEKLQEERNKRAIERSMQAPKKRTGRQVMYRSRPIRKENAMTGSEIDNDDNDDEIKYLS